MTDELDPFQMYLSGFDAAIAFVEFVVLDQNKADFSNYLAILSCVHQMKTELEDLERGLQCNTSTQEESS